jgi:uncharacterized protein (TIGR02300 family)
MPAKDLGAKHTCYKCQTKFYDLKKAEPICPKCGADQRQSPANKPTSASEKRSRPKPAPAPAAAAVDPEAEEVEVEGDEDDIDADDADDDVEEDEP